MNRCKRDDGYECPSCGARQDEDCPYEDLSTNLLVTPAIGGVEGATCDAAEGICESCQ